MLTLALVTAALADAPLADWREETIVAAWVVLDGQITASCAWPSTPGEGFPTRCDTARLDAVIRHADAFVDQVAADARIVYLSALASRYAGQPHEALRRLVAATALDAGRAEVWADLAEVRLSLGDADGAVEAARALTRLRPTGSGAWVGWLQLAQAEATRGHAAGFEAALQVAFDNGLRAETLVGQPAWERFGRDATIGPALDRSLRLNTSDDNRRAILGPR
jgi:hypothetical protein